MTHVLQVLFLSVFILPVVYDAKDPKYRILYNHFNQPGHDRCLTMKVRIIEKIYHHTNSSILSTPYRTDRELFWIKELGTAMPYGCNDNKDEKTPRHI
jgi:hypothetical protein